MNVPRCYMCRYIADALGNFVECKKLAETGSHMFVDWYYWNDGAPEECPLRDKMNATEQAQDY